MSAARFAVVLVAVATILTALPPLVPASQPATLPFVDTFDRDTIASGEWDVIGPSAASISGGDLRLIYPTSAPGLGGISRPLVAVDASSLMHEATVRIDTSYRWGIMFRGADAMTILAEASGNQWLFSYHNQIRGWSTNYMAPVTVGQEVRVAFVLRDEGTAEGRVYDAATDQLMGQAFASGTWLRPSLVQTIETSVWKDSVGNPAPRAVVHELSVREGDFTADARADPTEAGRIVVTWPSTGAGSVYTVERRRDAEGWAIEATMTATHLNDTHLATGTYRYRVTSSQGGSLGTTGSVSVTSGYASRPAWLPPLPGPTRGELQLAWSQSTSGGALVTGYRLLVYASGEARELAPGASLRITDRYLPAGDASYYLSAVTAAGEGEYAILTVPVSTGPLVVGFGDSVGAGHGLGTSVGYPDNNNLSHSQVLGRRFGGAAMTFAISGACADALGEPGASPLTSPSCNRYKTLTGEVTYFLQTLPPGPGQDPSLFTISIGGNDIDFAECMTGYLKDESLGPCEPAQLRSHLDALKANVNRNLDRLQAAYPDTPIVLTQYYNPFPAAEARPACGVFTAMAAGQAFGSDFNQTDGDWERQLEAAQGRAAGTVLAILGELNRAIADLARPGVTIAAPDYADHDMCRSWRDAENGLAFDAAQTWAFAPDLWVAKTDNWQFGQRTERSWSGGLTPYCVDGEDPPNAEGAFGKPNDDFPIVHVEYRVDVNCTPHPTIEGQREIARAVLAVVAPEREL